MKRRRWVWLSVLVVVAGTSATAGAVLATRGGGTSNGRLDATQSSASTSSTTTTTSAPPTTEPPTTVAVLPTEPPTTTPPTTVQAPPAVQDCYSLLVDFVAGWQQDLGRNPSTQELNQLVREYGRDDCLAAANSFAPPMHVPNITLGGPGSLDCSAPPPHKPLACGPSALTP